MLLLVIGIRVVLTVAVLERRYRDVKHALSAISASRPLEIKAAGAEQSQQLNGRRLARDFYPRLSTAGNLSIRACIACFHCGDGRISSVSVRVSLLLDTTHAPSRRNPAGTL